MPRGKKNQSETEPAQPVSINAPPELIAQALAELDGYDVEMSSIAGRKGAAFNRYEEQGLDRKVLRALQSLAKHDTPEAAHRFIQNLTQYGVAADVLPPPADDVWTVSVKQASMFTVAKGQARDEMLRARARKQGMVAGKKGHLIASNPYSSKPGSAAFVGWRDGFEEGAAIRKLLKPDSDKTQEVAPPGPRRGGRRAATAEPETQQQKDEAAYRAGGVGDMPPAGSA